MRTLYEDTAPAQLTPELESCPHKNLEVVQLPS